MRSRFKDIYNYLVEYIDAIIRYLELFLKNST